MSKQQTSEVPDFEAWLRERRLAREHRIPHLVRWVQRFLRLEKLRPRESWSDTLRVFLDDLDQSGTPDWQIRQAADAVSLYCGQFRGVTAARSHRSPVAHAGPSGSRTSGSPGVPDAAADVPRNPTTIVAELERLLRLRHYSPRTERSYVGWVRRYLKYVGDTASDLPSSEDAKTYLSHLAIRGQVSASTQNQAFNALLFLHRHVLHVDLDDMTSTLRARRDESSPWCSRSMRFARFCPRSRADIG